jgi:hypothetical protein
MVLRHVLIALPLCGCASAPDTIPKADFATELAPLFCDRYKECSRGGFDSDYADKSECESDQTTVWGETLVAFETAGCAYSESGAGEFYGLVLDMTCGEFYAGDVASELDQAFTCG